MARVDIVVRLQFEGMHYWPGAPQDKPEAYLVHPHRHVFHVEATRLVMHDDREIEIIAFKREIKEFCEVNYGAGFHTLSCEMMAKEILRVFRLSRCSVLEDGENGAEVTA